MNVQYHFYVAKMAAVQRNLSRNEKKEKTNKRKKKKLCDLNHNILKHNLITILRELVANFET